MARIFLEPVRTAVVVENPHSSLDTYLAELGIRAVRVDKVGSDAELIDILNSHGADLLFKRSRVEVTREVVEAVPSLQAVQLCCIGDDSVDKQACADHGVMVFNDPVSNGRSVVEMAVGHMVTLARRFYETNEAAHQNEWHKNNVGRYEVMGKRIGIVGLGNIGRQVARVSEALGMEVCFYDTRMVAQEVGVEMGWRSMDTLESLFSQSDIVSVHVSARDAWSRTNEGLLDQVLCKLGSERPAESPRLFLNLARGNVHSAGALREAVLSGQIRRAAVDVYPSEPGPGQKSWENPYADLPFVVCTPHIGAATQEAQPRIARRVSQTIGGFLKYGSVRDCVFAPRQQLSVAGSGNRGRVVLSVVHSVSRGTKKAVDDAIYHAEADNLGSTHRDLPVGVAYDLSLLDRPLTGEQLEELVDRAQRLAGDETAVRAVRQIVIP